MVATPGSSRARCAGRLTGLALVSTMLLVLSSCRIPELRRGECGRSLPSDFAGQTTPDNSAQVGLEEFFGDPLLIALINEGLAGNQELKILAQEVQIACNEVHKRRGAIFPFFSLGTSAGVDKPSRFTRNGAVESQLTVAPGKAFPDPLPNFLVAANVSWEVDIWRALRNARDAASLRYIATAEGRNYVVTRLVAEIAENYYTLMALDKRLETLDSMIALQEQSLQMAIAKKEAARGTELAVQRFQAEVQKNQSEKLIVQQDIIETENRINFLLGRYPQTVPRLSTDFINLSLHALRVGVPSALLRNRPDIRQAERELAAAGLDVDVARARFNPSLTLRGGVGYEAFNPRYLFVTPDALVAGIAGDLVMPVINRSAIEADYSTANSIQLQRLYDYQRTILNAFTEVVNRISMVENYGVSIDIKKQQLASLEASVTNASLLFQNAQAEYIEVLFAQRDLMDARMVIIETKKEQLGAIVNAYQALGGGCFRSPHFEVIPVPAESASEPGDAAEPGPALAPPAPAAPDQPTDGSPPGPAPMLPATGGDEE